MVLHPLVTGIGTGLVRSVLGWIQKSYSDGKVEVYEWKQLAVTVLRTVCIGLAVHYGFGIDDGMATAGITFFVDIVWQEIRKFKKK